MLIKKLTEANGLPNNEKEVREIIMEELKGHVDSMKIDHIGNLIVEKNVESKGKHLAIAAHMDEVGLVVSWIEDSGLLRFQSWGCDPKILPAKVVKIGKNKITGVIGTKPIHLQAPGERKKAIKIDDMYIDIGAKSKAEAKKYVSLGDYVAFDSEFVEFGEDKFKAKAFDDRAGCAIAIGVLKSDIKNKITAVFSVQEETGLRGAMVASANINADLVLILEGTISADMADVDDSRRVTTLGQGPAISLLDKYSVYNKKYINQLVDVAEKNGIPYQFRRSNMGGTDAGPFHTAHTGTPAIGVAVPCRYLHSPVSIMDKNDFSNMQKLVSCFIDEYNKN